MKAIHQRPVLAGFAARLARGPLPLDEALDGIDFNNLPVYVGVSAGAFINKGDFEDPYSKKELAEKFHELADPVWGRQTADALFLAFGSLENLPDIHHLTRLAEK